MTSTETRYFVGGTYEELARVPLDDRCEAYQDGYRCSLRSGDIHDEHAAAGAEGYVYHVWDNVPPQPIVEQPTERTELDRLKASIRTMAGRKLRDGYGTQASWDRALIRLGVEPLTEEEAPTDLVAYQAFVRQVAEDLQSEHSWCDDGTERVLQDLGIEKPTRRYRVKCEIRAARTVYVEVDAESREAAWQKVDQLGVDDLRQGMDAAGYDPDEVFGSDEDSQWRLMNQDASTYDVTEADDDE